MKKTYITPSIRIVRIEASEVMMAGSDGQMGYTSTGAVGQEVLSKRKSLWDDDEW